MKKINMIILLGIFTMSLYGCSFEANQYSPDQVIQNALEETTPAYYGEVETKVIEKDEETVEVSQEWRRNDGKIRMESQNRDGGNKIISVNDGSKMMVYEVEQNKVYIIDDAEILSFNQPSPKELTNGLLEMIRDTHEISTANEVKVAGRDTHRLLAKPKKSGTIFGDLELWIDKENWLVLKMILHTGDVVTEMTYTKIDFNAKISPDLFTVDLPEDVEIENMMNMPEPKEILLAEIPEKIGKSVIHFLETEELRISLIELYELQGELNRNEVSVDYTKADLPLLTLSVFESPEGELEDIGGEAVEIRNQNGFYTELGDFRSVFWTEDGLTYSIVFIDPNLTLEELINMTEEMEAIK